MPGVCVIKKPIIINLINLCIVKKHSSLFRQPAFSKAIGSRNRWRRTAQPAIAVTTPHQAVMKMHWKKKRMRIWCFSAVWKRIWSASSARSLKEKWEKVKWWRKKALPNMVVLHMNLRNQLMQEMRLMGVITLLRYVFFIVIRKIPIQSGHGNLANKTHQF